MSELEDIPGARDIILTDRADLPYRTNLPDEWKKGCGRQVKVTVVGPEYVLLDREMVTWIRENSQGKSRAFSDKDATYIAWERHTDATLFRMIWLSDV